MLAVTLDQVRELLLRRAAPFAANKGSTGIYGWCEAHGVNRTHVSDFMNAKRMPGNDMLDALGLEWRVMRKVGERHARKVEA
jgi:hypothetical protein